jgi:hypothetical protein
MPKKPIIDVDSVIEDWCRQARPFDLMTCGACLSMHRYSTSFCDDPKHERVIEAARKYDLPFPSTAQLDDWIKSFPIFLKLRKRFASFYPEKPCPKKS